MTIRRLLKISIILLCIPVAPLAAQPTQQTTQTWFVGGWRGTITQPSARIYDGVFSLKSANLGEVFGTSSYVELDCGGTLTLLSVTETTLEFQEKLTYGTSRCIDGLKKTLTLRPDMSLDYAISPNQGVTATAILAKASNAALSQYIGVWRGVILPERASPYSIIFRFNAGHVGDRFGTSYYPELGCGGILTLLSVTATSLMVQEQITFGAGCGSSYQKEVTFVSSSALDYSSEDTRNSRLTRAHFLYLPLARK
jgi:hypothetical protein